MEQGTDELLSVKSGFSKMSGATNFDRFDKLTIKKKLEQDPKLIEEENPTDKAKKTLSLHIQETKNDLDFLTETNQ